MGSYSRCRRVFLVTVCVAAVAAATAPVAHGQTPPCKQLETAKPATKDARNLVELQPSTARPTFDVELGYQTSGSDDISFTPKEGKRPGQNAYVAAEFTDAPRFQGHRLGGDRFIAAQASKSGRRIILDVCFEHIPQYAAGRWSGTVAVYGPKIADFTYAIVITTKWPRWTAWLTIGLTIVGSLIIALLSNLLTLPAWKGWKDWRAFLRFVVTAVLAILLALLCYWSVYASNETWGSNPPSDLTALVGAAFAAAVGGVATAKRLLSSQ